MRIACLTLALLASACGSRVPAGPPPVQDVEVVHRYPHDANAFTEGLFYLNGFLYESTGITGQSSVRKVNLETGEVVRARELPPPYFGEGIVNWNNRLVQLSYRNQTGFVFDLGTFAERSRFEYEGEGWGLTQDGTRIIMSDGTPSLRFLDPETLRTTGRLQVTAEGSPVANVNELEWVKGEIYANVWQKDLIARINPKTGEVVGWLNLIGLWAGSDNSEKTLNGIAWDAAHERLFVTGKKWPYLFEIRVKP